MRSSSIRASSAVILKPRRKRNPAGRNCAGRLRERVLRAIRANDEKLGAVQLYIQDVMEDLTVTKREERVFQPDNDTKIITVQEPRQVSLSRVRLFGDKLRCDYLNSSELVSKAFSFDGPFGPN